MTERIPKSVLVAGVVLAPIFLVLLAALRPGYFTNLTYLGGLLFLEFLFAAIWMYRQVFFPLILIVFLFAGSNLHVGNVWTEVRWLVLGVGGVAGCVIMFKDRRYHFGLFHTFALFSVLAALVSAAASRYPSFALLKALSLFLLFLYGATGARLAVSGRENQFFAGLLAGCELFVGALAVSHFAGFEVLGNPNSLGAVMAVAAPILLWGTLLDEKPSILYRRQALFAICLYLVFDSHARAGIGAALITCGLLCLALRRYRLFASGLCILLVLVAAVGILRPAVFTNTVSSVTSSVLYKSKDPELGLLASREAPWQAAIDNIRAHFWFGTGFGTTDNGLDASARLAEFSTNEGVTAENGSSYLAIVTWVGMLGVLPFVFLLLAIVGKVLRTVVWMFRTRNPNHPAVPLAMVIVVGLLHAGLEDWLFAPGYYLCVFFWSLAFVLVDFAPSAPLPRLAFVWRPTQTPQGLGGIAPSR